MIAKLLMMLLAIFLPPLVVFLVEKDKEDFAIHFLANVVLCCFVWIPAVLHAWYVVFKKQSL